MESGARPGACEAGEWRYVRSAPLLDTEVLKLRWRQLVSMAQRCGRNIRWPRDRSGVGLLPLVADLKEKAWTLLEDRAGSHGDVKGETQEKEQDRPESSSFFDVASCDLDALVVHVDAEPKDDGIHKELETVGVSSGDKLPVLYSAMCGGKFPIVMIDVEYQVAVMNISPYFLCEVFNESEIQSGADAVHQGDCGHHRERMQICYTQTGDPPYKKKRDTVIASSLTPPIGSCPDQKTTCKKLMMKGRHGLIKQRVGINIKPSPPLPPTTWDRIMVNLGENEGNKKQKSGHKIDWNQAEQNKNSKGDISESYLVNSAKKRLLLGDATKETDDLDNLSGKEGDGNMILETELNGTENVHGLPQNSSGSKSKRLKGDGDVSTSLSAGSFDEHRRDQ